MSKTYVNTGFAKCFILFMAIVILLEGCVYLGLAIWGITQQDCSHQEMDIGANPFKSVVDLIYFISQNCDANPTIKLPGGLNQDTELQINWAKSFMVTNRMYIFMIVYAVISGLWIVASLLVIATICGPVTRLVSAVIFWPWFLVVIAGSILDVVASVFSGIDISHTTSAESTFDYIGVAQPDQNVMAVLGTFDAYFITPAVVMTCISSRVVIIWLLNIFGTSFCLSLSRVLSNQRNKQHKHHKHQHHHHQHDQQQQQQQQPQSVATTITAATAYSGNQLNSNSNQNLTQQARNETQNVVEYATVNRPAPLVIAPQNQTQRQLSPQRNPAQSPYSANGPALTPDVVVMENVNRQTSPAAATGDETTYRKTDSHPDRLDYPPKTPMSPNSTSPLSADSLLNNRYSQADGGFYSPTAPANQAPQRVSDELRSQLPWSYTSMLGSKPPQPPRKPNIQVYPQIPEPDYNEDTGNNQQQQQQQRSPTAPAGTGVMNDINQSQQAYSRW